MHQQTILLACSAHRAFVKELEHTRSRIAAIKAQPQKDDDKMLFLLQHKANLIQLRDRLAPLANPLKKAV